jgi:hypothetical protein
VIVPTTVRVEAGWDRSDRRHATVHGLGIRDHDLDSTTADTATRLALTHGVSVADAHVGALAVTAAAAGHVVTMLNERHVRSSSGHG